MVSGKLLDHTDERIGDNEREYHGRSEIHDGSVFGTDETGEE